MPITLAPKFILTANIEASDGGAAIVAGNERVIRARLSDAKFFYETDLKTKLEDRLPKFDSIVFHEKLGSQGERIARIERLAAEIAPLVGADVETTKRAARLAKADLLTEVVGEFPELQGLMGKYYALAQGEDAAVAQASEDHYKPQGPADRVPTDPVSIAVALADKIDTLVGFWAIDEKPTGSKDPFALRRAALGLIRLLTDNQLKLPLAPLLKRAYLGLLASWQAKDVFAFIPLAGREGYISANAAFYPNEFDLFKFDLSQNAFLARNRIPDVSHSKTTVNVVLANDIEGGYEKIREISAFSQLSFTLLVFFADRLKGQLREQGARHDLVDAVFAAGAGALPSPLRGGVGGGGQQATTQDTPTPDLRSDPPRKGEGGAADAAPMQDDLLMVVRRVEALAKFLDTDDGKTLRAGVRRASNILGIEEKKDKRAYDGAPDAALFRLDEEKALAKSIAEVQPEATAAVAKEDFAAAMTAMARLRGPVDAFFDKVKVNDDDAAVRENRLKLLNQIRAATRAVADFSKIQD